LAGAAGACTGALGSAVAAGVAGAGLERPKTFSGLIACYNDGLPFYTGNLASTVLFCAVLFGGYLLLVSQKKIQVFLFKNCV